jgi:ribosomal protein S18 acetylase RimI-like enzyme
VAGTGQTYPTGTVQCHEASNLVMTDGGAYMVTAMTPGDVDAVANVHVASFGNSFLAIMGPAFLRHYFRTFLDYPEGCGLICRHRQSAEVVGFVCGTENVGQHYRVFLRRRLLPAMPSMAARVVRDRRFAGAILSRAWRVSWLIVGWRNRGTGGPSAPASSLPPASLMTIGVHPAHRRQRIGEMLVRSFTGEMARRGVPRVKLGVRDENVAARRLYERLGWRAAQTERADDDRSGWMYVRDIDIPDSPAKKEQPVDVQEEPSGI